MPGLASMHDTRGGPLGPPCEMGSASVPDKVAHYWDHAAGQEEEEEEGEVQIQDFFVLV